MPPETISSARANLYQLVDQVLASGEPVVIKRNGRFVRLVADEPASKLANIKVIPDLVSDSADTLPDHHWDKEWRPFI